MKMDTSATSLPTTPTLECSTNVPGQQARRSSSRPVRRKKFDDELVEYSSASPLPLSSSSRGSQRFRTTSLTSASDVPSTTSVFPSTSQFNRRSSSVRHGRNRSRPARHSATSTKDLGRWKPTDDLALISAVLQTNDLRLVERGVKFSCRFTYQEIYQRWQALLYDPVVSKVAMAAVRNLHPDMIAAVQAKALFSVTEEELLAKVKSNDGPTLDTFQALLQKHPQVFHVGRTSKSLQTHWSLMKQYQLLSDQSAITSHPSFSDAEDEVVLDTELSEARDEALERELMAADRRAKREIRKVEWQVQRMAVLVEAVPGANTADMDSQTLAVLRGRMVRYLMRSKEVSIGRSAKDHAVDIDLALEGAAHKVSRRQGTIRVRNNGDFFLSCEGRRPFYVDGRPVLPGTKQKLNYNSVIEIAALRFIFQFNHDLINMIRQEAAKLNVLP